ncbi:mechanosensitive ion channel family protein [Spirochaeta cellobiosiphila]|uniref:mechanosensitive ion channel family protein n=1 Tax=Spirochaeta cellobiosiphila TaxID=504483 RepID=UPI000424C8B0|nr:mechanosensitive ion channel family protein [Spirochaeta cellobiosiphila]
MIILSKEALIIKKTITLITPIVLSLILVLIRTWVISYFSINNQFSLIIEKLTLILVICSVTWALRVLIRSFKDVLLSKYNINDEDNLKSRKVHTQVGILEKVLNFLLLLLMVGMILLSFDSVRQIGVGLFASAGLAGIVIGLSAQKVVGAVLAGIQIAFTQPFRLEDAVIVENEWGWIEEIHLTYVVVRLWDKRRLVLPSNYFLEKPFQNWTRNNAEIVGSVFLYLDYSVPLDVIRTELTRLLNSTSLWDHKVNVLQVTDSTEVSMEIRILVSARNSPTAWDLRVFIREKLIEFIQREYPDSLPRRRYQQEHSS